jgi:acetyl esterase
MPVDAKLQAILDAGKALGRKPVELQTPAEARAERAEMVAQFVPMPEYAAVRVQDRTIFVPDGTGGREIAVRVYRPATGDGPWPVVVFFHGGRLGGLHAGDA